MTWPNSKISVVGALGVFASATTAARADETIDVRLGPITTVVERTGITGAGWASVVRVDGQRGIELIYPNHPDDFGATAGTGCSRSTDDGATWTPTLEHTGGGSMGARGDRTVTVTGLTFIPQDPATVYSVTTSMLPPSTTTGVATPRVSRDGGATWEEFSGQLAEIHDLALGIDGRNLFAASAYGVARLQFD